jgi:hypothetical protein
MLFDAGGIFAVLAVVFWVWALVDCIMTDARICRFLPKIAWIVVVLVFSDLGALLWFLIGRPDATTRRLTRAAASAARPRPVAPDDLPQPASNAVITDRRSAELDQMLAEWEEAQRAKRHKPHDEDTNDA